MESQTFDDLARALASGATRRGLLKGVLAGALGLTGISGRASAQATTVQVCHLTGDPENPVVRISVSGNAIPAHEAHGDTIDPEFSSDPNNCDGCGIVCPTPENGTAACVEGTCGFACDDGYQPNPAGDGCEAISACPEGYEEVNGGCFEIVNTEQAKNQCLARECEWYGSVDGSDNFLCAEAQPTTRCTSTSDCDDGSVCQTRHAFCFVPCG